jgi:hypothetical protein
MVTMLCAWYSRRLLSSSASIRRKRHKSAMSIVMKMNDSLGLTEHYSSPDKRFEVDSANAARGFLEQHGIPKEATQLLWDAIALHQTLGVAQYKEPVVALLYHGVGFDVMGDRFEELSEQTRHQVVSAFPRDGFKNQILHAFLDGFRHKPETTFGNISSDVCERYLPGYKRPNFCDLVLQSPWNQ